MAIYFEFPESVDEILAARPIFLDDCELSVRRCLPITRRYPSEAFITVRKLLVRTKAENPADVLPDDETLVEYLSLSGGKIDYYERLNDTTALVQFDDYDPVDLCCLSRPHFIKGQEIEVEKCIDESLARGHASVQQNSDHVIHDDYTAADMAPVSPLPTSSVEDQMSQLRVTQNDMTTRLEHEHEQLVASLAAEWEQTARERIRLQRLTLDSKQEYERLQEDNKKYQKMFSESLKEQQRVQEDGKAKLTSVFQQVTDTRRRDEQSLHNVQ